MEELKKLITEAWENRELLKEKKYEEAVRETVDLLDKGRLAMQVLG